MKVAIKIGTSTLTHATGVLNIRRVEEICKVISDIKNAGHDVVIISSGAIAMGVGKLGLNSRPGDIPGKQACASVGQCELLYFYDRLFSEYHHTVAPILMTGSDVENEERHANFVNTLARLLEWNAIPIINENDTVATDEIVIGDNDTLAAIVACSIHADKLILLSDIDGLYTADPRKDPHAELIQSVTDVSKVRDFAGQKGSAFGTGGMETKLNAAQICLDHGVEMILANGARPENLYDILDGKAVGTRFGR
ncbi:MAG: glutamate 5-kinase [Clostridia bacterium]|nr:glutamate 5-kinase [Clostridia bacterium]